MRDFAQLYPTFWTRGSGRVLRGDAHAQLVAVYLFSAPTANMIGLYYLPLPTMCHEIGMTLEGASKALGRVIEAHICEYDEASELVWVPEMANYQIGRSLTVGDKRRLGVEKALSKFTWHRFYTSFIDKYKKAYNLWTPSPIEAPSMGPRSQDQDQEQDHDPEQNPDPDSPSPNPSRSAGGGSRTRTQNGTGSGKTDHATVSAADVETVWKYFLVGRNAAGVAGIAPKLDVRRRTKIIQRLTDGFSVAELQRACDGLWRSPEWTEQDRADIGYVCRNADTVERFAAQARNGSAKARIAVPTEPPPRLLDLQQAIDAAPAIVGLAEIVAQAGRGGA